MKSLPLDVAAILVAGVSLVGGASLARYSETAEALGVVGEFRFILLAGGLLTVLLLSGMRSIWPPLKERTTLWLASVLAVHGWVVLSIFWSDQGRFSFFQLYEVLLLLTLLVVMTCALGHDPARGLRWLLGTTYALALAIIAASLVITNQLPGEESVLGFGGIGLARVLGDAAIAAFYFAFKTRRFAWLIPVPLFVLGVLQSGSRAAALALVAVGGLWWWLIRRRAAIVPVGKRLSRPPLIAAAVLGLAAALTPVGRAMVVGSLIALLTTSGGVSSDDTTGWNESQGVYLADRDVIYKDALRIAGDNPLSGVGLGTYRGPWGELYPHDLLLSFAVDAGLPSAVAAAFLLGVAFVKIARHRTQDTQAALAAATFFLVASLFAGSYYDARQAWMFLALGLMIRDRLSPGSTSAPVRGILTLPGSARIVPPRPEIRRIDNAGGV